MKILIVNLQYRTRKESSVSIPLAIYHIAAILERNSHDIEIFDPLFHFGNSDLVLKSKLSRVDIIIFSANSFSWNCVLDMMKHLRASNFTGKIVIGGVHPSVAYNYILNNYSNFVDYVVVGEAESSLPLLIESIQKGDLPCDVPGVAYLDNAGVINVNPTILCDLSNSDIVPLYNRVPENFFESITFETSRGCKSNCKFCSIIYKNCWRSYNRDFNDYKMGKLLDIMSERKLSLRKHILFTDDCFTTDTMRASDLLNLYADKYQLNEFSILIEARAIDLISSPTLISSIQRYPKISIQIGIESGYDEGFARINKPVRFHLLIELCELLKKKNLTENAFLSFIIGFPFENADGCERTIQTMKMIKEKYGVVSSPSWWMPMPSMVYNSLMEANPKIDYSIFDKEDWVTNEDFFYLTHPLIQQESRMRLNEELSKITMLLKPLL